MPRVGYRKWRHQLQEVRHRLEASQVATASASSAIKTSILQDKRILTDLENQELYQSKSEQMPSAYQKLSLMLGYQSALWLEVTPWLSRTIGVLDSVVKRSKKRTPLITQSCGMGK
ncbi:MAG: hypothetical protein ACLRPC_01265 [Streptococcus sp.]